MHPAILGIALSTQLMIRISDHVPNLHVERTCKANIAGDKLMGTRPDQTYAECVSAERAAQQELEQVWSSQSGSIRAQCIGEANALGVKTYVDLLACVQINNDVAVDFGSSQKQPSPQPRPPE